MELISSAVTWLLASEINCGAQWGLITKIGPPCPALTGHAKGGRYKSLYRASLPRSACKKIKLSSSSIFKEIEVDI